MKKAKRFFKRQSHHPFFKGLAGFGRALNRFYENRNHDVQSNGELTLLKKLNKVNPSVIIDGGANIGSYAKIANQHIANATIYAFEPVKDTFNQLTENVDTIPLINPINKGLYKETKQQAINIYNSSTHSSLVDIEGLSYSTTKTETIELLKGDQFVKDQKIAQIDLLKLDVEGAEYDAILGFRECFEKGNIRMVQFEYGYINITTKKLLIDFYNLFDSWGYQVGKVFPKSVEFRPYQYKYEDFLGPNYIAVRKTDTELIKLLTAN